MSKPTAAIAMGSPADETPKATKPSASIPMRSATATPVGQVNQQPKTSGLAVASMVCGIIGLLIFGVVLGPLAIILGAAAINNINSRPQEFQGLGMAKAGIICGIIAIVIWIILLIVILGA